MCLSELFILNSRVRTATIIRFAVRAGRRVDNGIQMTGENTLLEKGWLRREERAQLTVAWRADMMIVYFW